MSVIITNRTFFLNLKNLAKNNFNDSFDQIVHSEVPPIDQIYYYSPGGKRRVRHSTGGSSCSEDTDKQSMAAATKLAGEPARKAVDLFGAKQLLQKETKQIKKPFSLSKVLKPPGIFDKISLEILFYNHFLGAVYLRLHDNLMTYIQWTKHLW